MGEQVDTTVSMEAQIQRADTHKRWEREMFCNLFESALPRMKAEVVRALKRGTVAVVPPERLGDPSTYCVSMCIPDLDVSSAGVLRPDHVTYRQMIRHFEENYRHSAGIPLDILTAEIADHVRREIKGIHVTKVATRHLADTYRVRASDMCSTSGLAATLCTAGLFWLCVSCNGGCKRDRIEIDMVVCFTKDTVETGVPAVLPTA
jgi:hypothetical protein